MSTSRRKSRRGQRRLRLVRRNAYSLKRSPFVRSARLISEPIHYWSMDAVAPTVVFPGSKPAPCRLSAPDNLKVSDSAVVLVRARCPVNVTPFRVEQGSDYQFYVLPDQSWTDFFIPTSAAGYARGPFALVQELFRGLKPLPQENWFALVGAIDQPGNHPFLIGSGPKLVTVAADGHLILFANDAAGFYWNNFGCLAVAITRLR